MGYKERAVQKFLDGEDDYKTRSGWRLYVSGGVLYSYGSHFPLAYRKEGQAADYLINGDSYSVTTSSHQSVAIGMLPNNVQVPFSALNAAGMRPEHVEIVAHTPDRSWYVCPESGREVTDNDKPGVWRYADTGELWEAPEGVHWPSWRHRLGSVVLRDPTTDTHWLSGMDENEPDRLQKYFLCELPRKSRTVADAYESLKPKIVRDALEEGIEVKRQGDVFLIPSDVETRELPNPSEKWAPVFFEKCEECNGKGRVQVPQVSRGSFEVNGHHAVKCRECDGTGKADSTHVATEVRRNGRNYVRGTVRHRPAGGGFRPRNDHRWSGRTPEHTMVTLGKQWHIAVPNRAKASFSAEGRVD